MPPKKKLKIKPGQKTHCFSTVKFHTDSETCYRQHLKRCVGLSSGPIQSIPGTWSETTPAPKGKVVSAWFNEFPWLTVDDRKMLCIECKEGVIVTNSFVKGCENFRNFLTTYPQRTTKNLLSTSNRRQAK